MLHDVSSMAALRVQRDRETAEPTTEHMSDELSPAPCDLSSPAIW